jgi:hypothetical protein
MKLLGIINVAFNIRDQLLIRFSLSSDIGEEMLTQWTNISYSESVPYNVLVVFAIFMLIKMRLKETCSRIHVGRYSSCSYHIQNAVNK